MHPFIFALNYNAIAFLSGLWGNSAKFDFLHSAKSSAHQFSQEGAVKTLSYQNTVVWQFSINFWGHLIIGAFCVVHSTLWSLLSSNIQREQINIFLVIFIAHQATLISGEVFFVKWRKYQNKPTNYTEFYSQTILRSLHKSMNGYLCSGLEKSPFGAFLVFWVRTIFGILVKGSTIWINQV